jgi:hypothetical protein
LQTRSRVSWFQNIFQAWNKIAGACANHRRLSTLAPGMPIS